MGVGRGRSGGLALLSVAALAIPLALGPAAVADDAGTPSDDPGARQQTFADAAAEFGVPENILLAVSYNQSRWEAHDFLPSEQGGYGPMNLTNLDTTPQGELDTTTAALHTSDAAAELIGTTTADVTSSASANIRGGAALLASYAKELNNGALPDAVGDWYAAVAKYAGAEYEEDAKAFADEVYATVHEGASKTTLDGQRMSLAASPSVSTDASGLDALGLSSSPSPLSPDAVPDAADEPTECPPALACGTLETAYHLFDPADLTNYCNYDTADRPRDASIDFIVIHDTEETYETTTQLPPNPNYCASWAYLVRSADGHVDQALANKNVSWHAGNWWLNTHSIGIEQEGWGSRGARWFTEEMYSSTARLVQYLADRYDIPLDRAHIIGHDNVPAGGSNPSTMHWDPGPYWDWNHFMELIGAPIEPTAGESSDVVTINPDYDGNKLVFSGCVPDTEPVDGGECGTSPALPSSKVQLRTAPSADAPLLSDPYFHPDGSAGTDDYSDLSGVAPTGAQYVVAGQDGDWTAIWYRGQKAWFHNPGDSAVVRTEAKVVTPKSKSTGIYGFPYPKAYEVPDGPRKWFVQTRFTDPMKQYSMRPGQGYAVLDTFRSDIYVAQNYDESGPGDRTDYFGKDLYYLIWYNHREVFVKASDMEVLTD